jgi:hypothetical protein
MLKRTKKLTNCNQGSRRTSNFENQIYCNTNRKQIFMACLDAHLYEIEYVYVCMYVSGLQINIPGVELVYET